MLISSEFDLESWNPLQFLNTSDAAEMPKLMHLVVLELDEQKHITYILKRLLDKDPLIYKTTLFLRSNFFRPL